MVGCLDAQTVGTKAIKLVGWWDLSTVEWLVALMGA